MKPDNDSSTRGMLLHMMKTRGALSVSEMAGLLGITEMAVRRHVNGLERDGLAHTTLFRQSMGRPTHRYTLTSAADDLFPKNYHVLTLDLLGELAAEEGAETIIRLFERRKQKLHDKYERRMKGKALAERVKTLADIQNDNGYMVELDRDEQGNFVLYEYNCPIVQVARRFDEACRCELSLFEQLLETNVARTECMTKGGAKCTYVVQNGDSQ